MIDRLPPDLDAYERGYEDALDGLLSTREVAERYRIPIPTLTLWHREHGLGRKVGKYIVFTEREAEQIAARHAEAARYQKG